MTKFNSQIETISDRGLSIKFNFNLSSKLDLNPYNPVSNTISNNNFTANIIIPNHSKIIQKYYVNQLKYKLSHYQQQLNLPRLFTHFGICIKFDKPTKIHIHNMDMKLSNSIKSLINQYGAVILKNVYFDFNIRNMGHRNRFPQLNFHIDRNPNQKTHYSLYTRNPYDDEQKYPRTSSTLFIPYLVAYLQAQKEGKTSIADKQGFIARSILYKPSKIPELVNSIILPHCWDEPTGTGEMSIIDNANMLHASYYPDELNKGYRIGVRYVS